MFDIFDIINSLWRCVIAKDILIRDIPDKLQLWIETERHRKLLSQKEFLLKILEEASTQKQLTLIEDNQKEEFNYKISVPFTFIDLFAGIGGFRIGFEKSGGRCLCSVEWDKYAQKTYQAWFGEKPLSDIRSIDPKDIPDHDIMLAGFPCQPFSIAGVSKKNSLGRDHGFKDQTQGTLFYNLATIAEIKRPPVLVLENVKNLLSHNKGATWNTIYSTLESLNYKIFYQVINGSNYVPQNRERIFIVCFDKYIFGETPPFKFPVPPKDKPKLKNILEKKPDSKFTLSDHLWSYLQNYAKSHREKGNGFGYGLADINGKTRTLSARYYKDGSEILIPQYNGKNPRRLTPRETARLMGFSDELPIVVSDTQAYKQFGNAVIPIVTEALAKQILKVLSWQINRSRNGCLIKK